MNNRFNINDKRDREIWIRTICNNDKIEDEKECKENIKENLKILNVNDIELKNILFKYLDNVLEKYLRYVQAFNYYMKYFTLDEELLRIGGKKFILTPPMLNCLPKIDVDENTNVYDVIEEYKKLISSNTSPSFLRDCFIELNYINFLVDKRIISLKQFLSLYSKIIPM
ncbi:hypothetical protein BFU36_00510 [Sulfolobus sp. A20]|uniref:hypothetical protein n=1 Tax=Sulfolobaceae TaxID=118883 RepID=UPI000845CA46|nr:MULTISPECIES: hypothetical protein [unclassified Sulfolobus]TRM76586.1 hypothetical protein DJ523_00700 [Sulfolobus sp. E5]TRM76999.1 hypothetical protein DJ532_06395 [Sulfolobus sp. A20-N-F8]TRM78354.1 hypothetical protein DJ528_04890 [Sulfolobus sp. B5]TRM80915.1 hypothetical protein DJ524_05915 [Sulfolobus sp. D5]TRM81965.1 hypothetical protein DJ522_07585 [Sulfolobus sp. F3]TRM83187.1 hypothetical protein DJ531_06495 [Sulfolobus sp. A20-N-F6]TRM87960.1 hypothetical protein DJ526_08955